MKQEDIILMADASGLSYYGMGKDRERFIAYLQSFAALVAAAENEACADAVVQAVEKGLQAAFEQGRQEGMKQERALWTLTKVGQEIEAQPVQEGEPDDKFCDANCVWTDHHPHCKLAQPEERNFCQRCGKRTADLTTIHTCTPPQVNT
jgi:hypothetical protein